MKIDIYNYIIKELKNVLLLKSMNTKYSRDTIFDSLIFILKSNISWNEKIIVNNNIVKTNSIHKHFSFLSKIDFFNTFGVTYEIWQRAQHLCLILKNRVQIAKHSHIVSPRQAQHLCRLLGNRVHISKPVHPDLPLRAQFLCRI